MTSIGLNPIWLHEMKAALAINKKEYKSAVKHLIGGKFYNRAHNVSSTYAFPSGGTREEVEFAWVVMLSDQLESIIFANRTWDLPKNLDYF